MNTKKQRSNIKRHANTSSSAEDNAATLLAHTVRSTLITLLFGGAIIVTLSLLAYFIEAPNTFIRPLGILGAALTAFLGGITSARLHKHSALLCGMLNGLSVMAILMLISLFFSSYASDDPIWLSLILHVVFLLLSVVGAFCGLPRMKEKRKKQIRSR